MGRSNVRKRSKGSWEIRYEKPAGKDGKRQQGSETVRGTKKAAQAVLSRIEAELSKTPAEKASEMPVEECCRLFLKERTGKDLRWSSGVAYKGFFKNYLLPECGHMPLATVDRGALQRVVNTMVDQDLDAVTVHSYWGYMTAVFSWAVKNNLLSGNPAKDLTLPEMSDEYPGQMLSAEEAGDLLAAFEGSPYWLPTFLGLHTGMRPGEVLGLSWDNVDLAGGTISVRHTLHGGRGSYLGPPKNKASVRTISVPPVVVEALRELEERKLSNFCWLRRVKAGEGGGRFVSVPAEFRQVCAYPGGKIMTADNWGRAFRSTLCSAGLKKIRLHDLRHTHASLLIIAGEPIHLVAKRLGHANVQTTWKRYIHLLPSSDGDAAAHFADILKMAR